MPHKRSIESLQRRAARRIILAMAYRDRYAAETVNRLSFNSIVNYIAREFDGKVHLGAIPNVEPGEVLYDSRGVGSFQRPRRDNQHGASAHEG